MTAVAWARSNLFRNRRDAVTTIVAGLIVGWVLYRTARFVVVTGRWEVVRTNLTLFLVGRYPNGDQWRVAVVAIGAGFVAGLVAGQVARRRLGAAIANGTPLPTVPFTDRVRDVVARYWPALTLLLLLLLLARTASPWLLAAATIAATVAGRLLGARTPRRVGWAIFALPAVLPLAVLPFLTDPLGWDRWGGMMLTLLLASVSMIACFPLGVLLALGRRSTLPALRAVSIGVIEFFRGIPLVVLVLMSDVALGFFFPRDLLPGKVVRVIVAFTIFTAAYVAEIVRGGLQSVPRGQTEAAQALGLSPVRITGLIVLPQALRNVIPALVGQFISLFKDTTLVFIIGFLDVLSVADNVTKQPEFRGQGLIAETLVFAALLFWVGSYTLSRESQRIERKLGVGTR
ncbi:MAG TPA: amino acid ABC transporter permease [Acidimicrobiales bacterium]|nr:amino acid ABC transporter permease [Acidimicrobiales bacterium]